jgi:protein O-mannosyl-transferase
MRVLLHYNGLRTRVACCGAALLAGVVYINALNNPFVYDDFHTVVENRSIARLTDVRSIVLGAVTRPLVNLSYAVDRALWGPKPFGFHVTNVLLHMVNVALLFVLAQRSGAGDLGAFATAALFSVHPMMTEAVGYISGRSEVLCATFFMLALLSGRRWLTDQHAKPRAALGLLTVALWFAALTAKESAAIFPLVLLSYDWLAHAGDAAGRRRRLKTMHLPLIGCAVAAGIVRLIVFARIEYAGQVSIRWDYALLELDVVRRYIMLMINPSDQTIFHAVAAVGLLDARTLLGAVAVAAMLFAIWRLRRTEPAASLGVLWFLLALLPSSAMILLDQGEPMAEHRVYLGSCGLFLAAGFAIRWLHHVSPGSGRLVQAGLGIVVLSLATMTVVRNAVWSDPIALWTESVDLAPTHYRPRLLLGEALQEAGRRSEAIDQYRTAIRLRPAEPLGYVKMGQSLAETGRWTEAREHFVKAIGLDPRNASARNSLAVLDQVEARLGIHGSSR